MTRDKDFQQGEIIFLEASGEILEQRNLGRGRVPDTSGSAEYLNEQCARIKSIYDPRFILSTENSSPGVLAQRVARAALMGPYEPKNLTAIMNQYKTSSASETDVTTEVNGEPPE